MSGLLFLDTEFYEVIQIWVFIHVFGIAEFLEPYSCACFVLGLEWMRNVIFSKVQKVFLEISTYLLFCWACVEAVVCLKVVVLLSERL